MKALLLAALLIPLAGALAVALLGQEKETRIAQLVRMTLWSYNAAVLGLLGLWAANGWASIEAYWPQVYRCGDHSFDVSLYFDQLSAIFLAVTAYLASLVVRFSRTYMHREEGFQRFFIVILIFLFGMNTLIFSGTVDILFVGWEVVGLSSFLLIGFYRRRIRSVENALTAYRIYRICDVGLLLSSWLGHIIWHQSLRFSQLQEFMQAGHLKELSPWVLFFFGVLLLLAAAGKSAQFPFSFWLPKAMEGPTPSSAIFYGALSIHAGVFLLLRFYPIWSAIPGLSGLVLLEGLVSFCLASLFGSTQSNIKGQIAYAAIAQVGLMLVVMALGYPQLALIYFVGHACLRTYQLLVSPSIVALRLRGRAAASLPGFFLSTRLLMKLSSPWKERFYHFALHEGYLEFSFRRYLLRPFEHVGRMVHEGLDTQWGQILAYSLLPILTVLRFLEPRLTPILVIIVLTIMLLFALSALTESRFASRAWLQACFSNVLVALGVVLADGGIDQDFYLYLGALVPAALVGLFILRRAEQQETVPLSLDRYHGLGQRSSFVHMSLLLCFLTVVAFPLSPTFIGEDMLLQHALHQYSWLALGITIGFIVNGLALVRVYARICLGPRLGKTGGRNSIALSQTEFERSDELVYSP